MLCQTKIDFGNEEIKYDNKCFYGLNINDCRSSGQNELYLNIQRRLLELLVQVKEEYKRDQGFKELGFEREICDTFFYNDSKYFMPILLTDKVLTGE